jgi:hypothetical protein
MATDESLIILLNNLSRAIINFPHCNWTDAFSKGQLVSKLWLITELKKLDLDLGVVFVCAGWVGTLPMLMFEDGKLNYKYIRSFDIDPSCAIAAERLNKKHMLNAWKFKATTADIFTIDYKNYSYFTVKPTGDYINLTEKPDTIINTSCDHIAPFDKWWDLIPKKKLVVLQNNDSKLDNDHVNNISSLSDMKAQAPMSKILYEGVLPLDNYNRYMLIGRK